jgi:hypothetical protein
MLTKRKTFAVRPTAFRARPAVPVQNITIPWTAKVPQTQGPYAGLSYLQAVVRGVANQLSATEGLFKQMQRSRLEFHVQQWATGRWPTFSACQAEIGWGDDTISDIGHLMFALWYFGWDATYRGAHFQKCDPYRWDPYYLRCV